ncbi:MAG: hypothetical protein II090_04750 [Elusimicrobia bacterium]|nr:hypothetical protein [Elusimicrobiota bacterium]
MRISNNIGLLYSSMSVSKPKAPSMKGCEPNTELYVNLGNNTYYTSGEVHNLFHYLDMNYFDLKDAGIKHYVDLMYPVECDPDGEIESLYIKMSQTKLDFMEPPFMNKEDYINKYCYTTVNKGGIVNVVYPGEKLKEERRADYDGKCKDFTDKFVKFIQMMQEGNTVIKGHYCDYEMLLTVNKYFNPKAEKKATENTPKRLKDYEIYEFENLYKNLSAEQKNLMGWDEKFEKQFVEKLEKNKKEVMYR